MGCRCGSSAGRVSARDGEPLCIAQCGRNKRAAIPKQGDIVPIAAQVFTHKAL